MPLELKSTLNLPHTNFSMKANLPQNEPQMLAHWQDEKLYESIRQRDSGAPLYVLYGGKDNPVILPQILTASTA